MLLAVAKRAQQVSGFKMGPLGESSQQGLGMPTGPGQRARACIWVLATRTCVFERDYLAKPVSANHHDGPSCVPGKLCSRQRLLHVLLV